MVRTSKAASSRIWSTPADVVGKLRRRWDTGGFLTKFASGQEWIPLDVPLRSPTPGELATSFSAVQAWAHQWRQANHQTLRIETKMVGGRVVGVNEIPSRVWVDSYDQLWSLLGVTAQVRHFTELLKITKHRAPRLAEWMIIKPLEVLHFREAWGKLVDTVLWIDTQANHDMYLRQIDVPGVDTKFIEGHRKILSALLDRQLAQDRIDATQPPSDFAGRYRFRKKPNYVRFRHLGHSAGFTELSVRVSELAATPLDVSTVFVVENEVTYLAFPPVEESIVVFGGGYSSSTLEQLSWLTQRELVYWGDIDTHGFAILNQLRRTFGHVRSMLMDRTTLLAHEGQWVSEPSPVNAHLERLRTDEAALYTDLVEGAFGTTVRLEQERVSYSAIERAVHAH
ncbi:MAG: DUF2220 family protein [Actinomycetota bacterium]|nr:DUF2220 family protein [Actinomycetota bacterium]